MKSHFRQIRQSLENFFLRIYFAAINCLIHFFLLDCSWAKTHVFIFLYYRLLQVAKATAKAVGKSGCIKCVFALKISDFIHQTSYFKILNQLFQKLSRITSLNFNDILGCALGNNKSTLISALWSHINDPISGFNDIKVVFNH